MITAVSFLISMAGILVSKNFKRVEFPAAVIAVLAYAVAVISYIMGLI